MSHLVVAHFKSLKLEILFFVFLLQLNKLNAFRHLIKINRGHGLVEVEHLAH